MTSERISAPRRSISVRTLDVAVRASIILVDLTASALVKFGVHGVGRFALAVPVRSVRARRNPDAPRTAN